MIEVDVLIRHRRARNQSFHFGGTLSVLVIILTFLVRISLRSLLLAIFSSYLNCKQAMRERECPAPLKASSWPYHENAIFQPGQYSTVPLIAFRFQIQKGTSTDTVLTASQK